jgi:MmpS family membrane protein
MLKAAKRLWIPLTVMIAVAIAALVVDRLHSASGTAQITQLGSGIADDSKPFNPERVTYEIYARAPNVATINYLDLDAHPQEVRTRRCRGASR